MPPKPTSRDRNLSAALTIGVEVAQTLTLARVGGRLARRANRQFGTPYAPLSRRDAIVTAYLAQWVFRLLGKVDTSALKPESLAKARADAKRAGDAGEVAARLAGLDQPRWNFLSDRESDALSVEQMRAEREAARRHRA